MGKFVSNRNETVRLFKNPVLEYFSHIHPATPVVVFVPVVVACCWFGFESISLVEGLLAFIGGALLWTFMEYAIHRWAFHYEPKSGFGKYVHFLVHGVHHDYPRDSTRLVMPLLVSVPLAAAFYLAFAVFGDYQMVLFGGFIAGYVAYDSMHYAVHHFPMKSRIAKFMKHYHLRHHYNDEHTAYGISSPLWDYVFGTTPDYLRSSDVEDEAVEQGLHKDNKDKAKGKKPVVENSL